MKVLHGLVYAGTFALAGYAALQLFPPNPIGVALWLGGAIVAHDLVLLPVYLLADRAALAVAGRWVNYVRVPAVLSGLLLLVFFPLIVRVPDAAERYELASGHSADPFLGRWLLVTAALFLGSAALFVVRRRSPRRQQQVLDEEG